MVSKVEETANYVSREHKPSLKIIAELQGMHKRLREGNVDPDFLDLAVIRMVTAIEAVLRRSVKTLVDNDLNCRIQGLSLLRNRYDKHDLVDAWTAVEKKELTIGDLISKAISPCSQMANFLTILDCIFGGNCKVVLIREDRYDIRDRRPSEEELDEILADLKELFVHRHVIVHERSEESLTTQSTVDRWLSGTMALLQSLCFYVERQYGIECTFFEELFPQNSQ